MFTKAVGPFKSESPGKIYGQIWTHVMDMTIQVRHLFDEKGTIKAGHMTVFNQ